VRKKTRERAGSEEGVEARFVPITVSLADESAKFANESLSGYLRISCDASNDISA